MYLPLDKIPEIVKKRKSKKIIVYRLTKTLTKTTENR